MKGYSVHLLFHVFAAVVGVVCGTAAALWLFGNRATALWVLVGALLLGVLVLAAQAFYIRGDPEPSRARSQQAGADSPVRTGTRTGLPSGIGRESGTLRSGARNHR